jgi:ABC-type transporter Mla subunit MlaD
MDEAYKILKQALDTLDRLQDQREQIRNVIDNKQADLARVNEQIDEARIQVQTAKAALKALL